MHKYRTHKCNELGIQNVNETVKLSGWIHRKRDHGQLIFIDFKRSLWINSSCCRLFKCKLFSYRRITT